MPNSKETRVTGANKETVQWNNRGAAPAASYSSARRTSHERSPPSCTLSPPACRRGSDVHSHSMAPGQGVRWSQLAVHKTCRARRARIPPLSGPRQAGCCHCCATPSASASGVVWAAIPLLCPSSGRRDGCPHERGARGGLLCRSAAAAMQGRGGPPPPSARPGPGARLWKRAAFADIPQAHGLEYQASRPANKITAAPHDRLVGVKTMPPLTRCAPRHD
jgi:hypothetical protein